MFSFRDHVFVDASIPQNQHITLNSAALTGYRGTGKSMIIRELLSKPLGHSFQPTFPHYTYHSNLVVVPDHLVGQWEDALSPSRVITGQGYAESWRASTPPEHTVLISYSALLCAIHKDHQRFGTSMEDYISRRKGIRTRTIASVVWDRVVVDEVSSSPLIPEMMKNLSWQFMWALQGGTSTHDEMNIVRLLYSPETPFGGLMDEVVYNYLPIVVPIQSLVENVVTIDASVHEMLLNETIDTTEDWVYPQYKKYMFHVCESWDNVLQTEPDETEDMAMVLEDRQCDWLYSNEVAPIMSVSINGVEVTFDLGDNEEEDSDEESDEETVESEEEEVVASDEFFTSELKKISSGDVSQCVVCLDRACNTLMRCGHTMCFICAASVSRLADPRCPHCRFKLNKTHMFAVGEVFSHSAVNWLLDAIKSARLKNENIYVVGDNREGIESLRNDLGDPCVVHSSELNGKVDSNVDHVILLDSTVRIPGTLSHPSGCLRLTRLRVNMSASLENEFIK
jgi:hypothetical protein